MTPATEAKAAAIDMALRRQSSISSLAVLLALLTSASKEEREGAKRTVRDLVRAGAQILAAERNAADLASFANRHEP